MKNPTASRLIAAAAILIALAILSGTPSCSGGSSGGSGGGAGIELPGEVSAVSAKSSGGGGASPEAAAQSMRRALDALARQRGSLGADDLPPTSDYKTTLARKFVEIRVLDVFGIIEQIFSAIDQTNYALEENVNSGPYTCLVAWQDDGEGGVTQKFLQTWVVRSTLIQQGGATINRVRVWILEVTGPGEEELIRAQLDIRQAPTRNPDDTLADLGIWEIRAVFGDQFDGSEYFFADADIMEDGTSRLRIQEQFTESMDEVEFTARSRGIIFRSATSGYGKVEYPDWDACFDPMAPPGICDAGPPPVEVAFSYNDDYLSVQVEGEDPLSFDRNDEHSIVHRYGVFHADDGRNVLEDRTFGFPVRFDDGRHGWYGAWQDRHQLWTGGGGGSVADGTVVIRQDVPPGQAAPTYTTRSFQGSLTRVNLVAGSLDQVLGYPVEIFLFNNFQLRYNGAGTNWEQCIGNDGMGGCASMEDFTAKLPSLAYNGDGDQRSLHINRCDINGCVNYIYDTGAGAFFEANFNPASGRWESNGNPYAPADGDSLWCSIGGRTYIQYTADFDGPETTTGWVEKTLASFDPSTHTPTFDPAGDREFIFELNREYFISNRGANLRVTRTASNGDAGDYLLFMEVHSVAKPAADLAAVYPDGTVLVEPWDPGANSTYALETDPADPSYLMLKYETVSSQDQNNGAAAGDVVARDLWGLRIQGDASPIQDATLYNWEYRAGGEFHGGVTYLIDDSSEYVLLDDPIRFQPVQLPRTTDLVNATPQDQWLTFSLMFDGHMHGLPDTWWDLQRAGFEGDQIPGILANNTAIPDGTEIIDEDGISYYVKALEVGIFLGFVDAFPAGEEPDMTLPDAIDIDADIPAFVDPGINLSIPNAALKYVEGQEVAE